MKIHRGHISHRHPTFPPGSTASYTTGKEDGPTPLSDVTEDIGYSSEDNVVIEEWIRRNMITCWHGLGTCKMASRDSKGVVDESLGVHGVHGLNIADLSILPENVCANTMDTALAIGEKAADIIIRELGLGN
jgi:alcohol oxidase